MLKKALTLACITLASNAIKLETATSGEVDMQSNSSNSEGMSDYGSGGGMAFAQRSFQHPMLMSKTAAIAGALKSAAAHISTGLSAQNWP